MHVGKRLATYILMAQHTTTVLAVVSMLFCFSLMWKGIKLTKEGQKQTALSAARQRLMEVERINSLITERFEQEDIPEEPLLRARHYINVPPRSFCDDRDFVVVVHSRLNDLETRSNWRRTYGSFQAMYRFALVFVVGRASTIEEKASLGSEVNIHEDILEVDFNDTYRNLTLKNIAALRYVLVACPEVPTVLKMDDDVAWNMEKAAKLANFTAATNKIHCSLHTNIPASRDTKQKWHVTYEEWSENVFPPYCYGLAYTIPRQGIIRVLQALQTQKFLWIDDIFVTGVLARHSAVSHVNVDEQYDYYPMQSVPIWKNSYTFALIQKCNIEYFFLIANSHLFIHKMTAAEDTLKSERI
ncbi:hypothetical protein Y032_0818g2518 [Ancylostoma ceylanicum]|uniref:Hexosyltransferase n=1 Tax=Ancylostoma ceylanicum TaxID=53326 RepID=A0A016WBH3_9BILA|nr:hypothetical protein Y032_0818g2518 [Ancylostoma ceylanicum]